MLPHSEDPVIHSSFVWIGYQRVTDGRTDGRTELPWLILCSALQAMRPRCKNIDHVITVTRHKSQVLLCMLKLTISGSKINFR